MLLKKVFQPRCWVRQKNILTSVHPEMSNFVQNQELRKNNHWHLVDIGVCAYLRGLFFEHDAEFGRKGRFWMGTN